MSSISDKINEMIEDALPRFALGEEIEYDTALTVIPGQGGQPMPMLMITFAIKAMTLGEWHSGCVMLPVTLPRQEQIDEVVQNSVQSLINIRTRVSTEQLAQPNGHGKVDPSSASSLLRP